MTQIRNIVSVLSLALAVTLSSLATARPAEACGGYRPGPPPTDEEAIARVVRAHVSWMQQAEIPSLGQLWPAAKRETLESWVRVRPDDLRVTAVTAEAALGLAVARVTLASGDRSWDEYYLLRRRGQHDWVFVGDRAFTSSRALPERG